MNDKRILVVDDETDLLEMVKSIFTRAGFTQVLTACCIKRTTKDQQNSCLNADSSWRGRR